VRRSPDFPLDDASVFVIVLGVEEERPRVYSRISNEGERRRVLDWINSRDDLAALLDAAFTPPAANAEPEDVEPDEDDEDERDEQWGALMFVSYAFWPTLSLRDLQPVDGEWLDEHDIEVEHGRVIAWDAERFPFVDAEVGAVCFRPGAAFPPSLREIEAVEEGEEGEERE
jgi:hypothetical protein